MAGHGGARLGAGRPLRELSRLAVRLIEAFPQGYEIAGRKKGMKGSGEDVQREVIANILADEILAGRGINVVRLEVDFMGKIAGKDDPAKSGQSPLMDALSRCPGLLPVTKPPLPGADADIESSAERDTNERTRHSKCDVPENGGVSGLRLPFFAPQLPLPLDGQCE